MKDNDRNRFAPESEDDYTDIADAIIENALLTIKSQIDIAHSKEREKNTEKDRTGRVSNDQEWCFSGRIDNGF